MDEAAALVLQGAPHGTVVLAEEQTAGIGRLGRSWLSEREMGLYSSTLLRLPLPPAQVPIASLLIGLAVAEGIQQATGLACDLRWPNDVLVQERKVAGVLPHLVEGCVVAGVGINVNNQWFASGLRTPATSLALAAGHSISREAVFVSYLAALESFCTTLAEQGTHAIVRSFSAASTYVLHRRVVIEETGRQGTTAGLDADGFLLLKTDTGHTERVASGGVRPVA